MSEAQESGDLGPLLDYLKRTRGFDFTAYKRPGLMRRIQKRMQRWASLTPQQRERARENYKRMAKASAEKRKRLREQWAEYQTEKSR